MKIFAMKRMLLRFLLLRFLLLCGCLMLLAGCEDFDFGQMAGDQNASLSADGNATVAQKSPTPTPVPVPVELYTIERASVTNRLKTTSTLVAERTVEVLSKGSGEVESITVEVGDTVRKGDVLARLDDDQQALALRKAEVQVEQLEQQLARNKELFDAQMLSQDVYEQTQFELDNAKLAVDEARLVLRHQRVLSPLAGTVTTRHIQPGNTLSMSAATFTITDLDSVVAKVYLPQRSALRVRLDQEVEVRADAFPEDIFTGTVDRVAPVVDAKTGTVEVVIGFDERDPRLIPGLFTNIEIVVDTRDGALVVPKQALLYRRGEPYVFVADLNVSKGRYFAEEREITIGLEESDRVEVTDGVEEGEQLVVKGQRGLKPGSPILPPGFVEKEDEESSRKDAEEQSEEAEAESSANNRAEGE